MADLDAPIFIVSYDATWPRQFESERNLLGDLLAPWLAGPMEHIGSTAVPGMPAKPIIDIMAAVKDLDTSRGAIPILEAAKYCYAPYRADVEHWFCKPKPSARTHHLHLVPYASRVWNETLMFRDRLRREPATARRYIALKLKLAQAHRTDRNAYTEGKTAFVLSVVGG
jgi:GrpB-like predicted nucleotidyltransferase (UPF0157 family)